MRYSRNASTRVIKLLNQFLKDLIHLMKKRPQIAANGARERGLAEGVNRVIYGHYLR